MKNDKALRYNEGKPRYSLIDFKTLEPMVRVLEFGEQKYSRDNWKKGLDTNEILDSMLRHITALQSGELIDAESGQSHAGHIMCNAMFLQYMLNQKTNNDTKSNNTDL
jgi:hypothetical protein